MITSPSPKAGRRGLAVRGALPFLSYSKLKISNNGKPYFTRALVRKMIDRGKVNPDIRAFVARLWRGINPKDKHSQVEAVAQFIKDHVKYFPDANGVEQVADAWDVLMRGFGDCDDLSVLTGAMLEAGGFQTRLILAGRGGPTHIFIEVLVKGDWIPVDTSRPDEAVFQKKSYEFISREKLGGSNMGKIKGYDIDREFNESQFVGWGGMCGDVGAFDPQVNRNRTQVPFHAHTPEEFIPRFPMAFAAMRGAFASRPGAGSNLLANRNVLTGVRSARRRSGSSASWPAPAWLYMPKTRATRPQTVWDFGSWNKPYAQLNAFRVSKSNPGKLVGEKSTPPFAVWPLYKKYDMPNFRNRLSNVGIGAGADELANGFGVVGSWESEALGTAAGAGAAMASSFIPGAGPIVAPSIGSVVKSLFGGAGGGGETASEKKEAMLEEASKIVRSFGGVPVSAHSGSYDRVQKQAAALKAGYSHADAVRISKGKPPLKAPGEKISKVEIQARLAKLGGAPLTTKGAVPGAVTAGLPGSVPFVAPAPASQGSVLSWAAGLGILAWALL